MNSTQVYTAIRIRKKLLRFLGHTEEGGHGEFDMTESKEKAVGHLPDNLA